MKQPLLTITTLTTHNGVRRVVVEGELDISTAPMLEEALAAARAGPAWAIVLDIEAVGFIDSTGLRALLEASVQSRQNGNRLRITKGAQNVRRLFGLTGADVCLPFVDSEREEER